MVLKHTKIHSSGVHKHTYAFNWHEGSKTAKGVPLHFDTIITY